MAKTNVYSNKRLVAVNVGVPVASGASKATVAAYGFMTNIGESMSSQLGHVKAKSGANYIGRLIIGGDAPKPAKVVKKTREYTVTSYVGHDRQQQALDQGWKLAKDGRYRIARHTKKSKLVYLECRGIRYAWRMRTEQYAKLQRYAANLGLKEAAKGELDLVYGPSFPKPPKVGINVDGEGGIDSLSTFCEPQKLDNLPESFFLIDPGNYS